MDINAADVKIATTNLYHVEAIVDGQTHWTVTCIEPELYLIKCQCLPQQWSITTLATRKEIRQNMPDFYYCHQRFFE